MMQSETIGELAGALALAQGSMGKAKEDAKNPHFRSTYATLSALQDAAAKMLSPHGLSFTQHGSTDGNIVSITTQLQHKSGEWQRSTSSIAIPPNAKNFAQALGSAETYLCRYGLRNILGIPTGEEEDDGNAVEAQPANRIDPVTKAAQIMNQVKAAGKTKEQFVEWLHGIGLDHPAKLEPEHEIGFKEFLQS